MRHLILPIVISLAHLAGCGTVVQVEGTYRDVWDATVDALTETSGKVPTDRDWELGVIEVQPSDADVRGSRYGAVSYRAEISPAGGDEFERRKVSLFAFEVSAFDQSESRRRDLESFVASRIASQVGVDEGPIEEIGGGTEPAAPDEGGSPPAE